MRIITGNAQSRRGGARLRPGAGKLPPYALRARPLARILLSATLALAFPLAARAALANPPSEDVDFLAEHVAEAPQDARFFSLAWPAEPLAPGRWQGAVAAGWNEAKAGFLRERGTLATVEGVYSWSERSGVSLLAFSDQFSIGGGSGSQVIRPTFVTGIPLDLPERAEFSHPRGAIRHYGIGAGWVREAAGGTPERARLYQVGVLVARYELTGFRFDYRLLGGADAGTQGTLEYGASSTFAVPYFGVGWRRPLGDSFVLLPHLAFGAPLPSGDFHRRITGPGFDLSSEGPGGKPGRIGDGFGSFGLGLLHRGSGLEIDLGSALSYPLFERTTHPGLDQAYLVTIAWHPGGHPGQRSSAR